MTSAADRLVPDWDAPGVGALMTTRRGGVSVAPFDSMNLRPGIGDAVDAVRINRERLAEAIGQSVPVWLNQVHGTRVVRLTVADLGRPALHEADASITLDHGIACTVQTADCLPALFASPRGVGGAHAGWRGLAGGVLEATVDALCRASECEPAELQVWLGPCIGPRQFEVGVDVLEAFGADPREPDPRRFIALPAGKDAVPKWLANLPQLARDRLQPSGVTRISGGTWCTVEDASRFFSFRRDRVTGRMVAAIWLQDGLRDGLPG